MEVSIQREHLKLQESVVWDSVLKLTKSAQSKNTDPAVWALQLSSTLNSAQVSMPSIELAHLLVSHICWSNHVPIMWKFLDKALSLNIVPPMLVLSLLSSRVIPSRMLYPTAYRLYIELLKRHAFSFGSLINVPDYDRIMNSIYDILNPSQIFGIQAHEPGLVAVVFVFSIVWQLLDASLDDERLLELILQRKSRWSLLPQEMDISGQDNFSAKETEQREVLHKGSTAMAIEIIVEFLQNTVTARILYLARRNMPLHWGDFVLRLRILAANSKALRSLKSITPESLMQLTSDRRNVLAREGKTLSEQEFHAVLASGSLISSAGQSQGPSQSTLWLPIDLFLEDAMDGSEIRATSAVEILTGLAKALQAVNHTTWHDTFLGLWISALRLVQRERDPSEGPVPRLDTCLCMLLSITTLTIASIIEEEESILLDESEGVLANRRNEKSALGKRREDLISSLQQLGDYDGLLSPPQSVSSVANQAAAKAIMYISGLNVGNGYYECISMNDMPINCSGNMRHLIVEACIARNLLDTSAYLWPGYVNARSNQMPRSIPTQSPGWSALVKGSPLIPSLVSTLVAVPASSLGEIEKIYEIALNGSDDEKISAATILCGASLVRGWNIQEHAVLFITRLLSTHPDSSGSSNHLIGYAPFFNVLLVGISSVDCVQIFSLHGLIPQLAGALIPICEFFGSTAPNISLTSASGEELSAHAVFSNAFTLLLRLWRFDHPPLEHVMGDVPPVGTQLSPEYLLLVRNSQVGCSVSSPKDRVRSKRLSKMVNPSPAEPMFMDSFPKLKRWYRQHQKCIAASLSGLVSGTSVHQIVDALLSMMFRKINRSGQPVSSTASASSNSLSSAAEDISFKLKVPAWDILQATPFVLDAALMACANGRVSPRELATGLKDLADFLPASLATIVSYFSAEVTRGIWKPAFMNGTDWPSPAANLSSVELQIKKTIGAIGVDAPSLPIGGNSPATLPLPLAALVSLTITYKLDKASERFLTLIGPCLNSLAAGCPWPSMPIITSLWAQKVRRWNDFLVFRASQTVFYHNSDAVVHLLKSCFTTILGHNAPEISSNGGVGALLGHGFGSHVTGGISPVAPGILYLRVHRYVRDVMFMSEVIVSVMISSVRDIASSGLPRERLERLKKTKFGMRYGQVSLAAAMTRVKLAASLGASFVWLSGGLSLVQSLIKETLPSWFISPHKFEQEGGVLGGMVAMLGGYALAYFILLCGSFAWGIDSATPASRRRPKVLGAHLEFLANALDGKISLGCDWATWRAYVSGFVGLMVARTPKWILEVDVEVLKRLSNGLRQWNEEELAVALLGQGGMSSMSAAAELIIEIGL